MKVGRLLLRATVGGFFVGHGTQKLFGWFDGHGLEGTAGMFEQLGLHPPKVHATAAASAETFGGLGLLLGFQTPLAASLIISTMITAIQRVHGKNGPWATGGGYEYNAVLIAAAATLAEVGPGELSIDHATDSERTGPLWALAALGLGVAGAAGAAAFAASQAPAPTVPSTPAPDVAADAEVSPPEA